MTRKLNSTASAANATVSSAMPGLWYHSIQHGAIWYDNGYWKTDQQQKHNIDDIEQKRIRSIYGTNTVSHPAQVHVCCTIVVDERYPLVDVNYIKDTLRSSKVKGHNANKKRWFYNQSPLKFFSKCFSFWQMHCTWSWSSWKSNMQIEENLQCLVTEHVKTIDVVVMQTAALNTWHHMNQQLHCRV